MRDAVRPVRWALAHAPLKILRDSAIFAIGLDRLPRAPFSGFGEDLITYMILFCRDVPVSNARSDVLDVPDPKGEDDAGYA